MTFPKLLIAFCLSAATLLAANADGTWLITREGQKGTVELELKLKTDGDKLTGTYGRKGGGNAAEIQDGKVDGDNVSFAVMQRAKDAERKIVYKGKVEGDELKGESGPEGGRMRPFTAKRQ
jgi:hypothetical protein